MGEKSLTELCDESLPVVLCDLPEPCRPYTDTCDPEILELTLYADEAVHDLIDCALVPALPDYRDKGGLNDDANTIIRGVEHHALVKHRRFFIRRCASNEFVEAPIREERPHRSLESKFSDD